MGKSPLIDGIDKIEAHLKAIQPGSPANEQFISEQQALVENLRNLIETFLVESHHLSQGYQALQATLTDKPPSKPQTP